ncbi:hypothetical protein M5X11_03400 [Paenibacillus alginolyticus]|uniref:hypothetical protein n=1 Tax=Paenibacillus alginolyticus TaxID=59839 RepID=UPI0003F84C7F|nr:hypothetical protein [Paenibacillus alginolyticus]MCY9664028.1 hypothetical protein [Paenibacillus alginolyticus]
MGFLTELAGKQWLLKRSSPIIAIPLSLRCRCMANMAYDAKAAHHESIPLSLHVFNMRKCSRSFLDANRLQAGIYEAEGSPSQTLSRVPPCVLTLFKEDIRLTVSIRSHGIIPNLSAQGEKSFLRKTLKKLFVVPSGNLALREPI